ncbi:MAG: trigger factor [Ruminococcaceae bacterium]|nr:trigger factor [Oscillospiraceae bacterium]
MILKNVEKTGTNQVKLEIVCERDEFQAAVEKSYKKNATRFNVQGFRRGRAPRKIIERMYGESAFYEDAVNIAYPEVYSAAVKEAGIEPVDRAEVELVDISADGFTFTAVVTVKPEVKLGAYKGLEAEQAAVVITEEDVDKELEGRRKRNGRLETVEREAAEGDTVVIDFEGFLDDVAFEGGKAENHSLRLGSGQFIPGFEDQLIGTKAGDEKDVNVTFPEAYQAEELAGKPVVFKVKVHEVKENVLPDLDDEFAKDVSEFETLAEFREDLKRKLQIVREKSSAEEFEGKLLEKLVENMEVEIPDCMIEQQLDRIAEDFEYRLRSQGMTLQGYLQMSGMDIEGFRNTFRDRAEAQVKTTLALEAVAAAENFEVSAEDIEAEYGKMAEMYKAPVEDLKKYMSEEAVKEDMLKAKAVELIKETAVKVEPKAEEVAEEKAEDAE